MDLLSLAFLAWAVLVGRCVLAALPVGSFGGHGLRELPGTVAVSLFLGLAVLATTWSVLLIRPSAGPESAVLVVVGISVVAAAIALVRVALAPAAFVPRHVPFVERPKGWVAVVCAASVVAAAVVGALAHVDEPSLWFVAFGPFANLGGLLAPSVPLADRIDAITRWSSPAIEACVAAATVVVIGEALVTLRRTAGARAVILSLAALFLSARGVLVMEAGVGNRPELLACAVGALGGVAWLRRGDVRGLALAALAFHALVWIDSKDWPIAAVSLACLALCSPRAAWRRATIALVVGLLPLLTQPWSSAPPPVDRVASGMVPQVAVFLAFTLALAFGMRTQLDPARREPLSREMTWLTASVAASIAATAHWGSIEPYGNGRSAYATLAEALVPCAAFVLVLLGALGGAKEHTASSA